MFGKIEVGHNAIQFTFKKKIMFKQDKEKVSKMNLKNGWVLYWKNFYGLELLKNHF